MRISDWSSDVCSSDLNWWFAHNVLGLWLTPIGVGAGYYFIPKIIGKPIYSYSLSLLGFWRSEEHTSELQSLMRISYAVFCLKKKKKKKPYNIMSTSITKNHYLTYNQ